MVLDQVRQLQFLRWGKWIHYFLVALDCVARLRHQFSGLIGSSLRGIDYLATGHKHDEGYQNKQDRKRPEDD